MKLWCFISLVATMVMASTAGAVEIYNKDGNILNMFGSFVGGHYFSSNYNKESDHSFIRYGLLGKTYINDRIVGFGMWEHEISLKNVEGITGVINNNQALLGYTGIKFGDFGSIDYGRNYGILYDVGSWTDVLPAFGGDISIIDNFLSSRSSNVVTYRNKNLFGFFDGFDFAVQYQCKNDVNQKTGRTIKTANGEGYGVSASYAFNNGIAASVAYANSKRTLEQKNLYGGGSSIDDDHYYYDDDNAEAYSCGLKYDDNVAYIAATYGETYHMTPFGDFNHTRGSENIYGFIDRAQNFEIVAQYRFDCGLRPSVSYLHLKANGIESDSDSSNYLKKYITIGTSYIFDKHIFTTMDYRVNLLKKNNFTKITQVDTDDILALGVTYIF